MRTLRRNVKESLSRLDWSDVRDILDEIELPGIGGYFFDPEWNHDSDRFYIKVARNNGTTFTIDIDRDGSNYDSLEDLKDTIIGLIRSRANESIRRSSRKNEAVSPSYISRSYSEDADALYSFVHDCFDELTNSLAKFAGASNKVNPSKVNFAKVQSIIKEVEDLHKKWLVNTKVMIDDIRTALKDKDR